MVGWLISLAKALTIGCLKDLDERFSWRLSEIIGGRLDGWVVG